jgi:Ca2+-binding RTX toxin-like protein
MLSGAGGNDRLFGGSEADKIFGGAGNDFAANSGEDSYDSVETLL